MDKYGAPDRGDGTANLDAIVNRSSEKFNAVVAKMSRVLNRPIGSAPGPVDYTQVRGNPDAHRTLLQNMMAQAGPMKGLVDYIEFVAKQEGSNGSPR